MVRAELVELLFERGPRTKELDQVILAISSTARHYRDPVGEGWLPLSCPPMRGAPLTGTFAARCYYLTARLASLCSDHNTGNGARRSPSVRVEGTSGVPRGARWYLMVFST
jgi:hypothetical protein